MKKKFYMKPECEYTTLLGGEICDMIQASKITGSTDQSDLPVIGDGGDNTDDAPPPSAKRFTSLWDDDEEEVDDIW